MTSRILRHGAFILRNLFSLKISVNRKVKQTVAKRVYTRTWKYNNASKKKERRRKKPKKPPSNETNKHTQQHMCTLSQCLMIYVYIYTHIHSFPHIKVTPAGRYHVRKYPYRNLHVRNKLYNTTDIYTYKSPSII